VRETVKFFFMSLLELQVEIERKEKELSVLRDSLKDVARKILFPNYYK
jgi:hypothetical protein